jgi:hypothetical protein
LKEDNNSVGYGHVDLVYGIRKSHKAEHNNNKLVGKREGRESNAGRHVMRSGSLDWTHSQEKNYAEGSMNEFDHFLEHTTKVGAVKLVVGGVFPPPPPPPPPPFKLVVGGVFP